MAYNGWSNYETWRINLELCDGLTPDDFCGPCDIETLADCLKDYAFDFLESEAQGLALGLAQTFLSEVDWQEIATNMLSEYGESEAA